MVSAGREAECRARIAVDAQLQEAAEQPDRRPVRQGGDDRYLASDVKRQHRHGDGDQCPDPAVWHSDLKPGGDVGLALRLLVGCHRAGQRRSSRCLHATHKVARGKA